MQISKTQKQDSLHMVGKHQLQGRVVNLDKSSLTHFLVNLIWNTPYFNKIVTVKHFVNYL